MRRSATGAALLDFIRFGASFAYTVDGGPVEEINFETFNAASATVRFRGRSVHPGSAKDVMVNASLLAMRFNAMLPPEEIPAKTEGYEGFYHLTDMSGDVRRRSSNTSSATTTRRATRPAVTACARSSRR